MCSALRVTGASGATGRGFIRLPSRFTPWNPVLRGQRATGRTRSASAENLARQADRSVTAPGINTGLKAYAIAASAHPAARRAREPDRRGDDGAPGVAAVSPAVLRRSDERALPARRRVRAPDAGLDEPQRAARPAALPPRGFPNARLAPLLGESIFAAASPGGSSAAPARDPVGEQLAQLSALASGVAHERREPLLQHGERVLAAGGVIAAAVDEPCENPVIALADGATGDPARSDERAVCAASPPWRCRRRARDRIGCLSAGGRRGTIIRRLRLN